MPADILDSIVARKRETLAAEKQALSLKKLEAMLGEPRIGISMRKALAESSTGIISEFKRRSPSKGWIHQSADPVEVTAAYEVAGASALSILTDEPFFGGSLDDVKKVRPRVKLPILRKDFIIDEYQLFQAKIVGADAVLLIAACLSKERCRMLAREAHELKLEVLLEIHSPEEEAYIWDETDMVGVNNRNLGTFHTDVRNSFQLAEHVALPDGTIFVSESGISSPATVKALREAGFQGFLIGENFMKAPSPGAALAAFIKEMEA